MDIIIKKKSTSKIKSKPKDISKLKKITNNYLNKVCLAKQDTNKKEAMYHFIHEQIDNYHNQKFDLRKLVSKYNKRFFIIEIIDNKLKQLTPRNGIRIDEIIILLQKVLKKYKVTNTILFINLADGYYYKTNDIPVFNFSLPEGVPGMLFPEHDVINIRPNRNYNINILHNKIIKYNPKEILNDIYFVGNNTTKNKSKIRERLSYEKSPFHVDLSGTFTVDMWDYKHHKYLLDLPGFQPWSIRLKFLFSTQRPIIRVSFYNSDYGEKNYWRLWYFYLLKPNCDYFQLTYDYDNEKPLNNELYNKIKNDILAIYHYLEKNENIYKKISENSLKVSQNITVDESVSYLYNLIETYTKQCSEKPIV